MSADDSRPAGDAFDLMLEPHERRGLRRATALVWSLVSAATFGSVAPPSVGEYVVRRRDDGREVLRIDAESDETTGYQRAHLEEQLAELTEAEFLAAYGL